MQPARRSYENSSGRFSTRTLEGDWSATPSNDDTRRAVLSGDTGALPWHDVQVPGEWRSHDAFADHAGSVLYRLRLTHARPSNDERTWIVTNGIFDQADIWLDSAYVGDQDDYFLRHAYDITDLCSLDDDHELIIEVNGARHAGIREPIVIKTTGPVAIDNVRILCRDASESRAHIRFAAELDAPANMRAVVRTSVDGSVVSERSTQLTAGKNRAEWTVDIVQPKLWWPASLGEQPMSDVVVEVDVDGVRSDEYAASVGLREISMTNWILHVNDERLYLKGAHITMPDYDTGTTAAEGAIRTVRTARDIGLDVLRLRNHVAHPALYEAADNAGLLIWQDIPSRPRGARGRRMVNRWAPGLVAQLGHHPSIAVWHHTALDRTAHRALVSVDDSRPVVSHGSSMIPESVAIAPRFATMRNFAAGVGHDLDASFRVMPNIGRFPTDEEWTLVRGHPLGDDDPVVMRRDIESLRRIKYTPSGGFCFPSLRDDSPLTSGSALDSSHVAQPSYYALEDACRPVIVVGSGLPATVSSGVRVHFAIHVVSDLRNDLTDARVVATVGAPGVSESHEWNGTIAADETTFVASFPVDVHASHGVLRIDLQVEAGEVTSTNSYVATITE